MTSGNALASPKGSRAPAFNELDETARQDVRTLDELAEMPRASSDHARTVRPRPWHIRSFHLGHVRHLEAARKRSATSWW